MTGPIAGLRLLVTRDREAATEWMVALEAQGVQVDARAVIAFEPARDRQAAQALVGKLVTYDWVVFSSANGARFFL